MSSGSDEEVYDIEKILKHKTTRSETRYFVQWKGYPDEDSWVNSGDFRLRKLATFTGFDHRSQEGDTSIGSIKDVYDKKHGLGRYVKEGSATTSTRGRLILTTKTRQSETPSRKRRAVTETIDSDDESDEDFIIGRKRSLSAEKPTRFSPRKQSPLLVADSGSEDSDAESRRRRINKEKLEKKKEELRLKNKKDEDKPIEIIGSVNKSAKMSSAKKKKVVREESDSEDIEETNTTEDFDELLKTRKVDRLISLQRFRERDPVSYMVLFENASKKNKEESIKVIPGDILKKHGYIEMMLTFLESTVKAQPPTNAGTRKLF